MSNTHPTAEQVRSLLISRYSAQIRAKVPDPAETPDSFDFLLEGVIDSFGVLEMVGAVESEFGIELDMSGLPAEQMTVLGPLVRYIAARAGRGSIPDGTPGADSSDRE
jgi:acyl carrier protein